MLVKCDSFGDLHRRSESSTQRNICISPLITGARIYVLISAYVTSLKKAAADSLVSLSSATITTASNTPSTVDVVV